MQTHGRLKCCVRLVIHLNCLSGACSYAFVEFEDDRDARDAYHEMKDVRFEGHRLDVQFAKNAPSASWRYDRSGGRGRSRSPPRRGRSPPRRRSPRRSPSPVPRRRSPSPRGRSPSSRGRRPRSPSPAVARRRSSASRSPVRGRSEERRVDRDGDQVMSPRRSRTPERRLSGDAGDGQERGEGGRSRSPSPRRRSVSPRPRSVTP
ncbi:hypothetical protein EDD21DRAFT_392999 [Dissophora ornata]|nr:hypothetical protein EDD21DRAFT_392999 [Dissophora ornata]